jgi:hypothetical protein
MTGIAGAVMQPARRRQVQAGGHAARLQKHSREGVEAGGLIGDPHRIRKLIRLRDEQAGRVDVVQETHARRIRIAGFAKTFGRSDPEDGSRRPVYDEADQRQYESRRRTGVARDRRVDLGQTGAG